MATTATRRVRRHRLRRRRRGRAGRRPAAGAAGRLGDHAGRSAAGRAIPPAVPRRVRRRDDRAAGRLRRAGRQEHRACSRASANSQSAFTVTLLNSSVDNAFAIPGGYVYVTRQLVALMNNEAELAGRARPRGRPRRRAPFGGAQKRGASATASSARSARSSSGVLLGNSALGSARPAGVLGSAAAADRSSIRAGRKPRPTTSASATCAARGTIRARWRPCCRASPRRTRSTRSCRAATPSIPAMGLDPPRSRRAACGPR